jgi:hypothetical protein
MAESPQRLTDEEAIRAAVAWGQQRYPDTEVRGSIAERTEADVYIDLEIPEEARALLVHVRRDYNGGMLVEQQEAH